MADSLPVTARRPRRGCVRRRAALRAFAARLPWCVRDAIVVLIRLRGDPRSCPRSVRTPDICRPHAGRHGHAGALPSGDLVDWKSIGKISYLGGHSYSTNVPVTSGSQSQGTRLFLNALFEAQCTTMVGPEPDGDGDGVTDPNDPFPDDPAVDG